MATDTRVTKRRITMTSSRFLGNDDKGQPQYRLHQAVDYVDSAREGLIEAYVAEATPRWDHIEVSEEFDAGPGGYEGATSIPARLNHDLAGQTFAAIDTEESN